MAYDFGPAGREALESLKSNASPDLVARIDSVLNTEHRWQSAALERGDNTRNLNEKLEVSPPSWTVPDELLKAMERNVCQNDGYCYLYASDNSTQVLVLDQLCIGDAKCQPRVWAYRLHNEHWQRDNVGYNNIFLEKGDTSREGYLQQLDLAARAGELELKPVQRMQLFIGDEPFGPVIE